MISGIWHKLIWSWSRRRVLGIALLAVVLNLLAINSFDAPSYASSGTQYQSYYWAAVSASSFTFEHPPLTAVIDGTPVRFETATKDDLGYPLILSTVVRLGIIDFDDETRARLATRFPDIEANREYMFDELRLQTQNLNRGMPILLGLGVLIFMWSGLIPAAAQAFARSWGLTVFATLQLLPHLAPGVLLRTMHSHGLVLSAWVMGMTALAGLFAASAGLATRAVEPLHSRRWYYVLGLMAGLLFGFVETIRRSTGQIFVLTMWLTLALVAISLVRAQSDRRMVERWPSVVPVVLLGATVLLGMFLFHEFIAFVLDFREGRTQFARPQIESIGHPIYFTLLVAISGQENSLGVRGEAEVVALVKSLAPGEPTQDSQPFIDEARSIFFDYASDHTAELVRIGYANFEGNAAGAFAELGFTFDQNLNFLPSLLIGLGVLALVRLTVREFRLSAETFATSFVAQLLLASAIALGGAAVVAGLTTRPAMFDVASAIVFVLCALLAVRLCSLAERSMQVAGSDVPADEASPAETRLDLG